MRGSELIRMKVFGSGMQAIGKVKDFVVDAERCILTDFVVEVNREMAKKILGTRLIIRHAQVLVPISIIDKIGDAVILKYSADQLEGHVKRV